MISDDALLDDPFFAAEQRRFERWEQAQRKADRRFWIGTSIFFAACFGVGIILGATYKPAPPVPTVIVLYPVAPGAGTEAPMGQ